MAEALPLILPRPDSSPKSSSLSLAASRTHQTQRHTQIKNTREPGIYLLVCGIVIRLLKLIGTGLSSGLLLCSLVSAATLPFQNLGLDVPGFPGQLRNWSAFDPAAMNIRQRRQA